MDFGVFCPTSHKDVMNELLQADYVNTFLVSGDPCSDYNDKLYGAIAAAGKNFYIYFAPPLFRFGIQKVVDVGCEGQINCAVLQDGWLSTVEKWKTFFADKPYNAAFSGLYVDEPFLCGISPEDFTTVTAVLKFAFPDKRIFSCFSVGGVAPDVWTTDGCASLDSKSGQYLTDVGFDMYHPFDETYARITDEMKRRMGARTDYKIWHIPCIMNYRGDKDEAHCVAHLNGCYDLLRRETPQMRGGLMCYAWWVSESETEQIGNIGYEHLRGRNQGDCNWKQLTAEIQRIGKEILHS